MKKLIFGLMLILVMGAFLNCESDPACDHDWSEWTVTTQPTYTTDGEQTRSCNDCGQKQTQDIEKLICNHIWNEWEETTPPTETEYGIDTRICDTCGIEQTREGREPISNQEGEIIIMFIGLENHIGRQTYLHIKNEMLIGDPIDNEGIVIFKFNGEVTIYNLRFSIEIEESMNMLDYFVIDRQLNLGNNTILRNELIG